MYGEIHTFHEKRVEQENCVHFMPNIHAYVSILEKILCQIRARLFETVLGKERQKYSMSGNGFPGLTERLTCHNNTSWHTAKNLM